MPISASRRLTHYEIIQRGARSWWVAVSDLDSDGTPLPYSRLVYFAREAEQARAWVARAGLVQQSRHSGV